MALHNHQHFLFLFFFQLTVIQLSATPISSKSLLRWARAHATTTATTTAPTTTTTTTTTTPPHHHHHHHARTCLHPCRDAAARARIETNYTVDAPINEQCYWRFRSSDEMLTGCLNNRWLVFVGDSEIRGIVLSLLKQLLRGTYENPLRDDISLELDHASYFGYNKKEIFDVGKFNLASMDFLIESNTWTGAIVSVSRWSTTKYSENDRDLRKRLEDTSNKDYQFLGHTRTGIAYLELYNKKNPKTHFTRVSYMFTRWMHEALGEYLPLLTLPGRLEGASTLIMNGGKWDMFHFMGSIPDPTASSSTCLDHPVGVGCWIDEFSLKVWNEKKAYELYLANFRRLRSFCDKSSLDCVWATVGWTSEGENLHVSKIEIESTMARALRTTLLSDSNVVKTSTSVMHTTSSSIHVLDRWSSSMEMGKKEMVDRAHYDNFANRQDLARLMGIICESFETSDDTTDLVLPPGRLDDSRKEGGDFCRVVIGSCITEGYVFSRRYCAPEIFGQTGRETWKYTCHWAKKEFQCE